MFAILHQLPMHASDVEMASLSISKPVMMATTSLMMDARQHVPSRPMDTAMPLRQAVPNVEMETDR